MATKIQCSKKETQVFKQSWASRALYYSFRTRTSSRRARSGSILHLTKAGAAPQHLYWCLQPLTSLTRSLVEPSSGPQNHPVSTYTTPSLHKASWSPSTLWSLSPSVTSVTWPSLNEVWKGPMSRLSFLHTPSPQHILVDLHFLTDIINPSLTSGCKPSVCWRLFVPRKNLLWTLQAAVLSLCFIDAESQRESHTRITVCWLKCWKYTLGPAD